MKGFRGVVLVSSLLVLGLCAQGDQVANFKTDLRDAFENVYGKNRPFQNYILQRVDASVWQQFLTILCQFVSANAPKLETPCQELAEIHRRFNNLFVENYQKNISPLITDPALKLKGTIDLSKVNIRQMTLQDRREMLRPLVNDLEILFDRTEKVVSQLQQKVWFEGSTTREIRALLLEVVDVQLMIIAEAFRQMNALYEMSLDANPEYRKISDIFKGLTKLTKEKDSEKRWEETLKILDKEPGTSYRMAVRDWHPDKFFAKNPDLRSVAWETVNDIFKLITRIAESAGKK